jgi:hypothetical protein
MLDSSTQQFIKVSTDGARGPYIAVDVQDLERVKTLLRQSKCPFTVDEDAISVSGEPATALINLGQSANVAAIQHLLDMAE